MRVPTTTNQPGVGLHLSIGVGPSGHFAAGFATQVKIGARLTPKLRLFFLSLGHWYAKSERFTSGGTEVKSTQWRVAAINGVGVDYFILPKVGLRAAVGLGGDFNASIGDDPNALGYSYLLGMTIDALDLGGDHRLTIDPFIHMLQHNQANLLPGTANQWVSRPIIGVTLNWSFR